MSVVNDAFLQGIGGGLGQGAMQLGGQLLMGTPKQSQVVTPWEQTIQNLIQSGTTDSATTQQLKEVLNQIQTSKQQSSSNENQTTNQNQATSQSQSTNQNVSGSQYSNQQQQENTNQNQNQSTNTSQNQSGTSTTQNLSSAERQQLNALIGQISGQLGNSQFSRQNAITASNDAMTAALTKVLQTGIGNVASAGSNFGAYNSTAQGALASRLSADAARAGAEAQLNTIAQYGQLQNQQQGQVMTALGNLFGQLNSAGGTTTTDQTSKTLQDMLSQLTGQSNTGITNSTVNNQNASSTSNLTGNTNTTGTTSTQKDESVTGTTSTASDKSQNMQGNTTTDTTQTSTGDSETKKEFDSIKVAGKKGLLDKLF